MHASSLLWDLRQTTTVLSDEPDTSSVSGDFHRASTLSAIIVMSTRRGGKIIKIGWTAAHEPEVLGIHDTLFTLSVWPRKTCFTRYSCIL